MLLFDHQKKILADDPKWTGIWQGTGSGKTVTLIYLAQGKTLVITPKILREQKTFEKECKKWGITLDLTAISKEDFKKLYTKGELGQFDTVIADECHTLAGLSTGVRYKNRQPIPKASKLFEYFYKYLKEYPPERLYLSTATPVRAPITVLAFAWLLGKKWNFEKFKHSFYIKIKKGYHDIWIPRKDEKSKQAIGKLVRQLGYVGQLSDYFDYPKEVFETRYVEKTKQQKEKEKEVALDFPDPLVKALKKHQVENGVLTGDEYEGSQWIKDNKIEAIKDYALEFPKLMIFARYIEQIHKIFKELTKEGYQVYVLTGQSKDRSETIKKAEESEACIFIVQSQISSGWEAPSFQTVIFASLDFSLISYIQAMGRVLRLNHLQRVLYIHLITKGDVDEHVYKTVVVNKMDMHMEIFAKNNQE